MLVLGLPRGAPQQGGSRVAARTLITFARSTRPGLTSLMVRLGLSWRLAGMLLTDVVLLFWLLCLSRCGSESFDVNACRGILGTLGLVDVAAAANASCAAPCVPSAV
jgi:hypothetical protein